MKKIISTLIICMLFSFAAAQETTTKGDSDYLGEIMLFAGTYTPMNYMDCAGQTLLIQQYSALYSILGTTYGGDGYTTFNLPDLRGRAPIGYGDGPTTSYRPLGQQGGYETVQLYEYHMPSHTHSGTVTSTGTVMCDTGTANDDSPSGRSPSRAEIDVYSTNAPTIPMADGTVTTTGSFTTNTAGDNNAHENMPPYLTIRYCICVEGLYPPRSKEEK